MKQSTFFGILAVSILAGAGITGAVQANEMAKEAAAESHGTAAPVTVTELKEVSADGLQKLIAENKNLIIIDSRGAEDYAKGHIPNAIPLTADEASVEKLAAIAPAKDATLVFYCGGIKCPASGKTAHKAAEAGYTNIYKYAAGMDDWAARGLPTNTADKAS